MIRRSAVTDRDARPEGPRPEAGADWQPMESAPRDGTLIVGWCDHKANPYWLENGDLTTYGAHVEGLGHAADGPQIIVWGGEFDDIDEGYIPPWWFRHGSEWEEAANPTHWLPLPPPPAGWRPLAPRRAVSKTPGMNQ